MQIEILTYHQVIAMQGKKRDMFYIQHEQNMFINKFRCKIHVLNVSVPTYYTFVTL